jgi:FimV-like protein
MDLLRKVEEENTNLPSVHFWLSLVHILGSRYSEAIEETKKEVVADSNDPGAKLDLAYAYSEAGQRDDAVRVLEEVLASKEGYYSPCSVAAVMLSLGREKEGLDWMERALVERDSGLLYFRSVPAYSKFLSVPWWADIERRMGLPTTG